MPPLRGLLWLQVLCAGPLHTEAVVLLVGLDSSRSQMLPLPQGSAQSVSAKVTSPPPEVMVSGWPIKKADMFGLALCHVLLLPEFAESSSLFPQACGGERRVILWEAGLYSSFSLQQLLRQCLKWIEAACLNRRISRSCYKVFAAWKSSIFTLCQLSPNFQESLRPCPSSSSTGGT